MSEQYLILIERLVREGRPEQEIERIVEAVVDEDAGALHDALDESAERLRAA